MRDRSVYVELYNYLDMFVQTKEKDIYIQIVEKWSEKQVEDFVIKVWGLMPNDLFEKHSYYNFYANSTLAGAPYPCVALGCRLQNIANLSRFAALYADKILVPSMMDKYYENIERGEKINRFNLIEDIIIILELKPLVMAGIVGFFSSYVCLCSECLKKVVTREEELKIRLDEISGAICEETRKNIQCKLQRDSEGIAYLAITGAETLGFHEQTDILLRQENKKIKKLLKKSKEVVITTEMLTKMGIIDFLFEPLIQDIFRVQLNTYFSEGSYLTNRPYDATLISRIQNMGLHEDTIEHTRMIENSLFHKVPVIGDVAIEKIVKLRQTDGVAFDGYRSKMNAILDTFDTLDRKAIKDIQRDIIIPELDMMEQVIHRNRQALLKSVAQEVLVWGGSIGFGVFSGMIPIDYGSLIGIIGGASAISGVADKIRTSLSEEEIKSNSFYFLYKLQKEYKKR